MTLPAWATSLPWTAIREAAEEHKLDPMLIAAIVSVESSGVAWATRYEPKFRWLVAPTKYADSLGITLETETMAQMHSYGLMQIMGATARGLGFNGYLSQLVMPDVGLYWAAKYLAFLKAKHPKLEHTIAAYNAGSPRDSDADGKLDNQAYVDKVKGRLIALQASNQSLPS